MTNFRKSDVSVIVPKKLKVSGNSDQTNNSVIGMQIKPGVGTSMGHDLIGAEISPRLQSAIALTGSASVIGLDTNVVLKGTTGDIAGSVRPLQVQIDDEPGSTRTISGDVSFIRIFSELNSTVIGKVSAIKVEAPGGTKKMDAFAHFISGSGCLVESTVGTVGGTQDQAIKILIGTTTYYVPLHTSVS